MSVYEPDIPRVHVPAVFPYGGRIKRTEEFIAYRPPRNFSALTPPGWAAWTIWFAVVVAVLAAVTRGVLFLFGGA